MTTGDSEAIDTACWGVNLTNISNLTGGAAGIEPYLRRDKS